MNKRLIDCLKTYIEPLKCLNVQYDGEKEKVISLIDEYLNYNVEGFEKFNIFYQDELVRGTSINIPIYSFQDENEENPYVLVVIGEPGEVHYSFRHNLSLEDCLENNIRLISFGMKTGADLCFMKNYLTDSVFIREQYIPKQGIIAKLYDFHAYDHDKAANLTDYQVRIDNSMINSDSAFTYPCFCSERFNFGKIYVKQLADGKYKIDVRDCDGRPQDTFIREGSSLYSVYYDFMVENDYIKNNNELKTK